MRNGLQYFGNNTPEWWTQHFESGRWTVHGWHKTHVNMLETLRVLSAAGVDVKGRRVLDIGCAVGNGTQMLHEAGAMATGADFVEASLRKAREWYPEPRFVCWDIRKVPEDFDVIITSHTIEHLGTDSERALRHLAGRCSTLVLNCEIADFKPWAQELHTGLVATACRNFPPTERHDLRVGSVCIWRNGCTAG